MTGGSHFNELVLDAVAVGDDALIGQEGGGWKQVTAQLAFERSGLERMMSVWPLFVELRREAAESGDEDRLRQLGSLEAEAMAVRQLIYGAAHIADGGRSPDKEAALAKLLGTRFEQRVVDVASRWSGIQARIHARDARAAFGGHLLSAWLAAPSFTIRGGASEILREIVVRAALPTAAR